MANINDFYKFMQECAKHPVIIPKKQKNKPKQTLCQCHISKFSWIDIYWADGCGGAIDKINYCPMCGRNLATDNEE